MLAMEESEKAGQAHVSYSTGVVAEGAKFAGSFAAPQREHGRDCVLPIPRAKITIRALLTPITKDWTNASIWKSALVEAVGTLCLVYTSGLVDVTIDNFDTKYTPNWVGVTNIFLLSVFILATATGSGGHLNPLVSFGTLLTGLTGFSRAILYMVGQTAGAAIAGGLFLASFGDEAVTRLGRNGSNFLSATLKYQCISYKGGGCFFDDGVFPKGRAFLIEVMSSFILLFLAYGVALDPRQAKLSGPTLGPFLVAASFGLLSFASSGLAPGYAGAGMNPARCLAFAIARRNFEYQWIWWFGPCAGAILAAIMYRTVPPFHALE